MTLKYTPSAVRDIQQICAYIADTLSNPSAADRLKRHILKACSSLKRQPLLGASLRDKTGLDTEFRYLVCNKHLIFYLVRDNEILVSRIIGGRMDYITILFGKSSP